MEPSGDPEQLVVGKKFTVERVRLRGRGGAEVTREVIRHPGAVCILPLLTGEEGVRVVMIRNRRFAVGADLWELPAGTLEPDEPPIETAGRELIEETGYEASDIEPIASFYTTPGMTDERMHGFVARGLRDVGQRLEEGEEIRVEVVSAAEALGLIDSGELVDGKSIALLLIADRMGLLGPEG